MSAGIWNLIFGMVAVAAGMSGRFALPFTSSPTPLIVVGVGLSCFGAFQIWQSRGR